MGDENEQIEGQEDEGQKELTRREARIQELTRRNTELERLVNMDKRIDTVANAAQQAANAAQQAVARNQPADDPEDKWTPFLKPKMGKIIEEALSPYKQAILQLADKNDKLETMTEFPEYRDPEIQAEVETIRQQRAQQSGVNEPRSNILTFLRGRSPEKFAGKKPAASEEDSNRQEDANQVHVESKTGSTSPNRATKGKTLDLNTASAAEIEKWALETGMGNQPI